jgi:transposase
MVDQSDDPSVRGVRRIEVITDSIGRRRWSADLKARIVAESFAPGAVVAEIARRHGARAQQVHGWRRDVREGRLALPEDSPAFAPIVTAAPLEKVVAPAPTSGSMIEVVMGGAVLRAPADAAILAALIAALRRTSC